MPFLVLRGTEHWPAGMWDLNITDLESIFSLGMMILDERREGLVHTQAYVGICSV